jgi:hypothetical protein
MASEDHTLGKMVQSQQNRVENKVTKGDCNKESERCQMQRV